jgi:sugar-phosphatase
VNVTGRRDAILFDLDGVLVDSLPWYRAAWESWAKEPGIPLAEIAKSAYGRRPIDVIREFMPAASADRELPRFESILATQGSVRAMPGARHLLERLPPCSWAIVTSSERRVLLNLLGGSGLPTPSVSVCGGDVAVGKPDPACYLLAAKRLRVARRRCVVVEDASAGVAAGKAAEMHVLALATTESPENLAGADLICASLVDAAEFLVAWVTP